MKYAVALSALAAATLVSAQSPDGCSGDFDGSFEFNPVPISGASKRDIAPLHKRSTCTAEPYSTLQGGVLTDQCKRTGEIVANAQFQYDLHLQVDATNTGGFSICKNNTLAIAGSAVFYHCLSGSFYNLYDKSLGAQCSPVYLEIIPCDLPSDVGSDCPADTPTSVTRSSSSSSASSTLATSSASSTPAAVTSAPATSAAVSAPAAPIVTVSMPYSYPAGNVTTPSTATGTVSSGISTGTASSGISTGTAKTSPIAFHGGAVSLAMGGKLLVSAVAIAALAFLA